MNPFRLFLALALLTASLLADTDAERIANVETQIQAMEAVLQKATGNSERSKLEVKLKRLKDEHGILIKRRALENRSRALTEDRLSHPLDALREKLRIVDASEESAKQHIQELVMTRRKVAAERDAVAAQLEDLRTEAAKRKEALSEPVDKAAPARVEGRANTDTKARDTKAPRGAAAPVAGVAEATSTADPAELEERLFTRNEELRSLSLQREAAENEVELAHEAERLREELKNLEHMPRANIRAILESREANEVAAKLSERLHVRLAELDEGLVVVEDNLRLARQKLAMYDEELALLEKQTGFFSSDPRVERLIVSQRAQKRSVQERVPHLEGQLAASQKARKMLALQSELVDAEAALRDNRFGELCTAYVNRLRWPLIGLAGTFVLYLILNYVVVRYAVRRANRPVARRLVRYGSLLHGAIVVGAFLFDDLTMFAATLGIVSAALVISLQDVCTSVFGWFVIMLAGKFRVGDRLEVDGIRGDIIDIDLLATTFNEINGWLGSDEPTGRIIVVPNNFIFKSKVLNYNHQHPYIWSRLDLTITFESPLARTLELFNQVLADITRADFEAARGASTEFRERYGTDDADYVPRIHTQIVDTGVLLSLYYVAHYKESCSARTRINDGLVRAIHANPQIQLSNPTINLVHTNTPPPPAPAAAGPARGGRGQVAPIIIPAS